jgi:putative membrane protein
MAALPNEVRVFIFSIVYAALGMVLLFIGYRVFDWLTPTDTQEDIFKNGNVAAAVLVGSFIIGLAIVILGAIHG